MFLIGVAGFVVTSALAGLSPGPTLLIGARVLQGLSGGLINPQVSGLVQQMFTGADRGRAFGAIGTVVGRGHGGRPARGRRPDRARRTDPGLAPGLLRQRPGRHRDRGPGPAVAATAPDRRPAASARPARRRAARASRPCACWSPRSSTTRCRTCAWSGWPSPRRCSWRSFVRRELRLTRARQDPLVDLRLFTRAVVLGGGRSGPALLRRRDRAAPRAGALLPARPRLHRPRVRPRHHGLRAGVGHRRAARRSRGDPARPAARRGRPDRLRPRRPGHRPDRPARARGATRRSGWPHRCCCSGWARARSSRRTRRSPHGRGRPDGQHGRRRPADLAAHRLGRRAGRHRSGVLRRAHRPRRGDQSRPAQPRAAPSTARRTTGLCPTRSSSPCSSSAPRSSSAWST